MGLTKDDIQRLQGAVREVVREEVTHIVEEKLQTAEKRLISAMDRRFMAQSKSMAQGFADLKAVMENTYVSREEFEQVKEELQNEVDDLKKQVQALQKSIPTPA
jgi:polyhydroxyalkanoate synthesis regulator protein